MSDDVRRREIAAEQRYVDRVYDRVAVLRAEAEQAQREGYRLAGGRTPGSLVERDAMVYHATRRLRELDAQYEGLVFGRLDLRGGEVRYVGRLGLRDANREPLVIDWRAPAAVPFYQATAEEPLDVVRRRVIHSRGQAVLDLSDDLLIPSEGGELAVVGDGALLASMARARGRQMRDIVATIQREQDEVIRAPATGVTYIEGGPGTGKTVVALHRAAYLLYRDRRRYEGAGVLLVGPSPTFLSYVERVLPSLGEETVELRSLGAIVDGIDTDRLDPPPVAALKGSVRMCRLLRRALREGPPNAPQELRLVYGGQVLRLDSARLQRLRADLNARLHHPNTAGPEVRRALAQELWTVRPPDVAWRARAFAEEIYDRDEFERFARAWWPALAPADVLAWLTDPDRVHRAGRGWLTREQARMLAHSWAGAPHDLSVADVALVDELRVLLGTPPRPSARRDRSRSMGIDFAGDDIRELSTVTDRYYSRPERPGRQDNYDGYAHVVVDEAQDLSPMQWRMIGRRGRQASWTIVGDHAQSAWPDPAAAVRARDEALRGKRVRRFRLRTNYRNSAEIFEFAVEVVRDSVPDADLPVAVRRTGIAPEHRVAKPAEFAVAVTKAVGDLLAAVDGTVGVIVAATRLSDAAKWLADVDTERVQVVDGMRAKGMEYDGVVVVAPEEIRAESVAGTRVLYVAVTRATQRLITVSALPEWWRTADKA